MPALLRMLQMTSQAFPIGGFSYSHGLESAVELGLVSDEPSLHRWLADVLEYSLAAYEVPMLQDMRQSWAAEDLPALQRLNREFLATREAAELRNASVQMGYSLRQLLAALPDLPEFLHRALLAMSEPALPCAWSGAAWGWGVCAVDCARAYLWSWAENQVLAAIKAVPLGQTAGQRVLLKIGVAVGEAALRAQACGANLRSNFAPGLAILCSQHETQYSRLFRS